MPSSSTPQIPAEAIEAAGVAAMEKHHFRPYDETTLTMLEAAYPHLFAVWKERLLSDEAVAAALVAAQDVNWDVHRDKLKDHPTGRPSNRDVVRAALRAAFQSLDVEWLCRGCHLAAHGKEHHRASA